MDHLRQAAFEQVTTMKGKSNAAATAGACHNFSIHWASMMCLDQPRTPAERMKALGARGGEANPVLQKAYVDAFGESGRDWTTADNLGVAIRGLTRVEYCIPFASFDEAAFMKIVNAPKHDAMIYSFSFPGSVVGAGGGTHTIAFFRKLQGRRGQVSPTGTQISAFDPNFGEYLVPSAGFGEWFRKLKDEYTGTFTTQRMMYLKENK